MELKSLIKLIETLGVPLAVALAAGLLLWKLIAFILKDLKKDFTRQQDELQADTKAQQIMVVRLIDRVRTLEINSMMAMTALLTKTGCEMPDWRRTRTEKTADLKEQLKDVSHNADES